MDKIYIRDLLVRCIVGINPEEREKKQDVNLNIVLETDLAVAGKTDRVEDTVDYSSLKKGIFSLVEQSGFFLIEKMAETVAQYCLKDKRINSVKVCVDKPGALRFARSVAVEVERSRTDG